jgi:hypothetical protein
MPRLTDQNMTTTKIDGTGYGFSATRIEDLGASEYTLVGICIDRSGSTSGFQDRIEKALGEIVGACRHSPRSDNLMLRVATFDHVLDEVHGFKPLSECNPDDYKGIAPPGGSTALFDASLNVVESVVQYGKNLVDQDFAANGIVFVITDGQENASKMTANEVKKAIESAVKSESLESIRTVLIGLSVDTTLDSWLQTFKDGVGFDQYVGVQDASEKSLAKLAAFVSKSISSQSQALGTGGPSQSLTF